jgi:hypothetical protein
VTAVVAAKLALKAAPAAAQHTPVLRAKLPQPTRTPAHGVVATACAPGHKADDDWEAF